MKSPFYENTEVTIKIGFGNQKQHKKWMVWYSLNNNNKIILAFQSEKTAFSLPNKWVSCFKITDPLSKKKKKINRWASFLTLHLHPLISPSFLHCFTLSRPFCSNIQLAINQRMCGNQVWSCPFRLVSSYATIMPELKTGKRENCEIFYGFLFHLYWNVVFFEFYTNLDKPIHGSLDRVAKLVTIIGTPFACFYFWIKWIYNW